MVDESSSLAEGSPAPPAQADAAATTNAVSVAGVDFRASLTAHRIQRRSRDKVNARLARLPACCADRRAARLQLRTASAFSLGSPNVVDDAELEALIAGAGESPWVLLFVVSLAELPGDEEEFGEEVFFTIPRQAKAGIPNR